jgi:hypothetical protein
MVRWWRSLILSGVIALIMAGLSACGSSTVAVQGSGANLHIGNADAVQKSGVKATATLTCPNNAECDIAAQLAPTLRQIAARLQTANATDYYLATSQDAAGAYQLLLMLPGTTDVDVAQAALTSGTLRFLDTGDTFVPVGTTVDPTQFPVVFTGNDLDRQSIGVSTNQANQPVITFAMGGSAKQHFADYTASHIGKYLTISLDWHVLECAAIQSEITGQAEISGSLTASQAHIIAEAIKIPPLPLGLTNVTATVG